MDTGEVRPAGSEKEAELERTDLWVHMGAGEEVRVARERAGYFYSQNEIQN